MSTTVHVSDLTKSYGAVRALAGVTFDVPTGTVFGLLGPNGAGKTTIVKILTTLTRPDSGTATVAGHDVAREPEAVRSTVGVVSQQPQFDPEATGTENLMLQARLHGLSRSTARDRSGRLLARFGLSGVADRLARTYSGGMQRKLDVALGLIHRPEVLFLDEPTTGLDPEARAEMWDEISTLAFDDGVTVVLTTHHLDEADQLATTVAIVDDGRVVAHGTPEGLQRELAGDAIHLEPEDPAAIDRAVRTLRELDGVDEVVHLTDAGPRGTGSRAGAGSGDAAGGPPSARAVRARVADGASALPGILLRLEAAGVAVATATVSRPSLDDVYLKYAGRSFAAADAAGSAIRDGVAA